MMNTRQLCAAAALLLLLGCGSPESRAMPLKLQSGKTVGVLSVMTMHFSNRDPALMIKYVTNLPVADGPALQAEADEVWQAFQADADRANLANAVVSATTPPSSGFIKTSQSYGYVFHKASDGTWQRQPSR